MQLNTLRPTALAALLSLGALACAKKGDSLIPVEVTLAGVGNVTAVDIRVERNVSEVKRSRFMWKEGLKVGVYVPSAVSGKVTVSAAALNAADVVIGTSSKIGVAVTPGETAEMITLEIRPLGTGGGGMGGMGGTGGAGGGGTGGGGAGGSGGAPPTDGPPRDGAGADGGPPRDGAIPDAARDQASDAPVRSWSPPENIEKDPIARNFDVRVAVNPTTGDAVVAFEEDGVIKTMRYRRTAGRWDPVRTVDPRGAGVYPLIGRDAANGVFVIWANQADDSMLFGLYESRSTDGGDSWSPPARLMAGRYVFSTALAVSRNGRARLSFEQNTGDNVFRLYSAYFDGTRWSTPAEVQQTNDIARDRNAKIAMDRQGGGVLAWEQPAPGTTTPVRAWASRFSGVALDRPVALDTHDYLASDPAVAITPDGKRAVVIWEQTYQTGAPRDYLASISTDGAPWPPGQKIVTAPGLPAPEVAIDPAGAITVAYEVRLATGSVNAAAVRYEPGAGWGTPEILETDNLTKADGILQQPFPQVAADGMGTAHVVWRKKRAQHVFDLYGRRYVAGMGWLPEVKIAGRDRIGINVPSLASSDSGESIMVWIYRDFSEMAMDLETYQVYASYFR